MRHEHMSPARRFERLSRLRDFKIDRHQIDPRGWYIVNVERRTIGHVRDVIVDTDRMVGTYLDVELDRKLFHLHDDGRILVPMASAHRDGDHHRLVVDGLSADRVAQLYAARAEHEREFWDRWWDVGGHAAAAERESHAARGASPADLQRALEHVGPGETVRIPVVHEEIIVERRPVAEEPLVTREK